MYITGQLIAAAVCHPSKGPWLCGAGGSASSPALGRERAGCQRPHAAASPLHGRRRGRITYTDCAASSMESSALMAPCGRPNQRPHDGWQRGGRRRRVCVCACCDKAAAEPTTSRHLPSRPLIGPRLPTSRHSYLFLPPSSHTPSLSLTHATLQLSTHPLPTIPPPQPLP